MSNNCCEHPVPVKVFDSREAKKNYAGLNYYRSSGFTVPPGYVGVVELTTNYQYLPLMTFSAIRIPTSASFDECYGNPRLGKRYRRWRCYQGLGMDDPNTQFDDFNRSVVRWGIDQIRNELVEHEYIVRPGQYYLIADKCQSQVIEDCDNPTFIDVSFVPVDQLPELLLPGCKDEPPQS